MSNKKILSVLLTVVLLVSMVACGGEAVPVQDNAADYEAAIALFNAGDYANALPLFDALGEYEASEEKENICRFYVAEALFEAGSWQEAAATMEGTFDYADEEMQLDADRLKLKCRLSELTSLPTAENWAEIEAQYEEYMASVNEDLFNREIRKMITACDNSINAAQLAASDVIVTDITGIGDPQIILHEGVYYCYATSFGTGFYVWTSTDLVNWSEPTVCMEADENHWGYKDFWAPEVVYHNGQFVMHYSARWKENHSLRIGVAVSDSPLGPFVDANGEPMFDMGYAAIDGSVLRYEGRNYFYYSRDCSENFVDHHKTSQIYCVELDETLTQTVGEHQLMTTPTFEWEKMDPDRPYWNEGPTVMEWNGKLIMNYSANYYASNYYSICVAQADSPFGPWEKYNEANPVLNCDMTLFGAGHNAFFLDSEGNLMTSFHVQTNPDLPSGDRRVCIGPVTFREENGIVLQVIG